MKITARSTEEKALPYLLQVYLACLT